MRRVKRSKGGLGGGNLVMKYVGIKNTCIDTDHYDFKNIIELFVVVFFFLIAHVYLI